LVSELEILWSRMKRRLKLAPLLPEAHWEGILDSDLEEKSNIEYCDKGAYT
jgi:hypothetical protein